MQLSNDIHQWIQDDGSFLQGLSLYQRTGGSQPYSYFERHSKSMYVNPGIKSELRSQLQKYLQLHPPSIALPPDDTTYAPTSAEKPEPESIQALRKKAIPYHKKYSHLKAELYTHATADQPDEKKLFTIAQEIMKQVIPKVDSIYDEIREWEQTGEVPDMPISTAEEKVIAKMKRIKSLRSRISYLKNKLKGNLSEQDKMKYEKELTDKELELEEKTASLNL